MIKIKACSMVPWSAVSFYRTMGVLPHLRRIMDVEVEFIDKVRWDIISGADILYLERPYTDFFVKACEIAKDSGVKIWADFDDDVFSVPSWNPAYQTFNSFDKLFYARECSRMADIITVTSDALVKKFEEYNQNVFKVPNAFNDYIFTLPESVNKNKAFLWRGSEYHRVDVLKNMNALRMIVKNIPEWGFHVVGGGNPWYLYEQVKCIYHNPVEIEQFFPLLYSVAPSISLSLLADIDFNRAKSNIAFIEGVAAGSCHVAPNFPEFDVPGVLRYNDEAELAGHVLSLAGEETAREEMFKLSSSYVDSNLRLSQINKLREKAVGVIMNNDRPFVSPNKSVFIGVITGKPKRYCDDRFIKNIFHISNGCDIYIIENTEDDGSYFQRLSRISEKYKNIEVEHMDIEPGDLFFQRAVASGYNRIREKFLKSEARFLVLVESDVFPKLGFLGYMLQSIQKYAAVGGVYYPGHHAMEWFDETFNDILEVERVFTGCTMLRREVMEKFEFRYDPDEPREFPDTMMSRDMKKEGYQIAIDTRIVCDHLHNQYGGRGHDEVTL